MPTITDVQAFWDSRPCNIRRSDAPTNSKQFMDETEARKFTSEPHIPSFAEYGKWTRKKVLEIGCGIGIDAVNFARAGAEVVATDLSKESLKIALKRAEIAEVDIDFWEMNAESFFISPVWASAPYDLAYAFGSIHHSPHPEKILRGIRPLLRSDGTLKLMVYNRWSWKSLWILLKYGHGQFWKFKELIARYSEAQTGCPITHTYSRKELRAMLGRNGFHVRKMYKDHVFRFDIEKYKRHEYETVWYFRWMPAKMFSWFERHFGWHWLVECTV